MTPRKAEAVEAVRRVEEARDRYAEACGEAAEALDRGDDLEVMELDRWLGIDWKLALVEFLKPPQSKEPGLSPEVVDANFLQSIGVERPPLDFFRQVKKLEQVARLQRGRQAVRDRCREVAWRHGAKTQRLPTSRRALYRFLREIGRQIVHDSHGVVETDLAVAEWAFGVMRAEGLAVPPEIIWEAQCRVRSVARQAGVPWLPYGLQKRIKNL